jgi:hypothetical protein
MKMKQSEKFRRWGLDKAAFLLLFALGLLLAKLMISFRSDFKLSEPVRLKGTGLQVCVPAGDNWKWLSNGFKYENNEFKLACLMQISSDSAVTLQWRYFLLPSEKTASQRLQDEALVIDGNITATESDKSGDFKFDYVKIDSEKITIFCGTTALPDGRILTLEVGHKGRGIQLAEKIFKALLASAKYHEDNPLAKGTEFLKSFKGSYSAMLPQNGYRSYYRIKDTRGSAIGFITDSIGYSEDSNEKPAILSTGLFFMSSGFSAYAEQSIFYSDVSLSRFDWTTKQSNLLTNKEMSTHILLNDSNLTVQRQNIVGKSAFTDTMLPETFFDLAVAAFLKSNLDTVMLDVILSDGKIAPVIISRINTPQDSVLPAQSAAGVEIFGTTTTNQKMFFDGESRLLSAEIQGSPTYRLDRATRADILADFPQWLDKIQQIEKYQLNKKK